MIGVVELTLRSTCDLRTEEERVIMTYEIDPDVLLSSLSRHPDISRRCSSLLKEEICQKFKEEKLDPQRIFSSIFSLEEVKIIMIKRKKKPFLIDRL